MKEQEIERIEADFVVIEVIDKATGRTFRRNLPVRYLETDNGVILSGETIAGQPSEIAFYSDAAIAKIHDLTGGGPDFRRCADD